MSSSLDSPSLVALFSWFWAPAAFCKNERRRPGNLGYYGDCFCPFRAWLIYLTALYFDLWITKVNQKYLAFWVDSLEQTLHLEQSGPAFMTICVLVYFNILKRWLGRSGSELGLLVGGFLILPAFLWRWAVQTIALRLSACFHEPRGCSEWTLRGCVLRTAEFGKYTGLGENSEHSLTASDAVGNISFSDLLFRRRRGDAVKVEGRGTGLTCFR